MQTAFNLPLIAKKSNHNETEVQAVLQKLKEKRLSIPIKNNDSTLILMKFEDERTIVGFKVFRKSKSIKKRNNFNLF
jgi:ATP-dependent DNA helicase RecQ